MSDAKGRALTIGVNRLSPRLSEMRRYDGLAELVACENDAKDMAAIATGQGFTSRTLATKQATRRAVIAEITAAAEALNPGDIFMLSFSGHGLQLADDDGAKEEPEGEVEGMVEVDRRDETWCLYDGELVDDELYQLWLKFKPKARILVFSDSCHSGTIIGVDGERHTVRRKPVEATVLLISASLDTQNAYAGAPGAANSVFTARLKEVWDGGEFRGNYRAFQKKINGELPPEQTSDLVTLGARNAKFLKQKPFTV